MMDVGEMLCHVMLGITGLPCDVRDIALGIDRRGHQEGVGLHRGATAATHIGRE
jgi:hypothetical protein